ncbi:hypothetical protein LF599_16710 [Pseudodesulfovibrio thermohalotolerans]|uniref:hypothetical protein n=1 Tax=Pseudodesulfovibrio thermohalotolerans TaxID=2880651 RepID=UPI0024420AC3|nr:hypothetical protein [Pseudodesulfovibrio thermohalotolerans]WFS62282.1 hypothetical protein LF599_16710 [Pseudodesulfovibrio thermohalotolerans]
MSATIHCPYCNASRETGDFESYAPFYVNCEECSRRYIVEPVRSGVVVYRDGEAPCCSDPDCRETEMAGSGQE